MKSFWKEFAAVIASLHSTLKCNPDITGSEIDVGIVMHPGDCGFLNSWENEVYKAINSEQQAELSS